jgi:hypothetical protein
MSTRGIRNNNPANIRRGCNWKGLAERQTDKEFCQFTTMTWGVRALLVTLRTYVKKYNLHTIREIITRWAPPSDGNNTEKYIEFIEKAVREIDASITLSLEEMDFYKELQHSECILYLWAKAMCKIESGYNLDYGVYLFALHLM